MEDELEQLRRENIELKQRLEDIAFTVDKQLKVLNEFFEGTDWAKDLRKGKR